METWPTLPQLARELGVADSTARRWTAAFPDLFPLRGRGAARRVHPQSREVLKLIQALYGSRLALILGGILCPVRCRKWIGRWGVLR